VATVLPHRIAGVAAAVVAVLPCPAPVNAAEPADAPIFFREAFDDAGLLDRGFYDGERFAISEDRPFEGAGCLEYRWRAGATNPHDSSGVRRLFASSETVYLRIRIRLSENWGWTGRDYHPHLMHFLTTENEAYRGPASSRLTLYVEPQEGRLRLAAQDMQNADAPHGLTQRPLRGGYNGRFYDSQEKLFTDAEWHTVEAFFQLNSLDRDADRARTDGVVRGWFDGRLVIDRTDVVLRSPDFPEMKFNQFLLTPYFGPGLLPHAQGLWIDDLTVAPERVSPEPRQR